MTTVSVLLLFSDVLNAFVDCAKRPKRLCQLNDKIPVDTSALFDMRNLRGETVLHVAAAAVAPDDPPSDESGESGCFSMDIELESSLDTCLEIVISEMTNNNNSTVGSVHFRSISFSNIRPWLTSFVPMHKC